MSKEIQALIIDEVVDSRNRLRQAVLASAPMVQVRVALTLRDALALVNEEAPTHLFFSSELTRVHGDDLLSKFSQLEGKGTSFIMVLQGEQRAPTVIIERFASGVDGFILDPYSADDICQALEHVTTQQTKSPHCRRESALKFLIGGAQKLIDQAATLKLAGKGLGETSRDIRRHRVALERLKPENADAYLELLIEGFMNAEITPLHEATRQALEREKQIHAKHVAAEEARKQKLRDSAPKTGQMRVIRKR